MWDILFSTRKKGSIREHEYILSGRSQVWKGHVLYDPNYTTVWKEQDHGDDGSAVSRDWRERGPEGNEITLYNSPMVDSCHYASVLTQKMHSSKRNRDVTSKLQVTVMFQGPLSLNKECALLWTVTAGQATPVQRHGLWVLCAVSIQLCCESNTAVALGSTFFFKKAKTFNPKLIRNITIKPNNIYD